MKNSLMTFKNEELGQIRIAMLEGEPIFNLHDTCYNLGYIKMAKGNSYLRKDLIESICKTLYITGLSPTDNFVSPSDTNQNVITKDTDFENTWIDEQSFYDLCLESKAKNARAFRRWVTGEVLPSIRRTGSYSIGEAPYTKENVQNIKIIDIALSTVLKVMDEAQINPMSKLMAAREFYKRIGLDLPTDVENSILEEEWYTVSELAEMLGVFSKNGRPAKEALTYVLTQIDIANSEKKQTWKEEKGWKGDTIKYNKSVMIKIAEWFVIRYFPTIINGGNREYEVVYKSMGGK